MKINVNGGERELVDEDKGVRDGILGGSKISFQSADLKASVNRQQQPQNTAEHWERFLHVRSIRVLLVENDDSTRHVVTALLRNCNYEVIEASNGLQAWRILEDLTNHIDIVLTEVVMPCLSGIALLRKITSHKTRKNIPVIMMSSHDSMGLVFSCLSKGAVDFLVKPIRKNELKNFWQHVWRRCQSSSGSGSGSESGAQTHKSVKSEISQKGDNSGSDDGEDNGSNGLNVGGGSDDGNGAQSSWTKQAVEFDSSRSMSPIDQVADCPESSTFTPVIRPNTENSGNKGVDTVVAREAHEQSQPDWSMATKQADKEQLNLSGECLHNKHKDGSAKTSAPIDGKESGTTRDASSILDVNNNATNVSEEPNFDNSLKRLRGVEDTGVSVQVDRCVWRRSEQSAFSRYDAASNIFKAPNGITGSSSLTGNQVSLTGNQVETAKRGPASDLKIHSTENLVYQSQNEVYNNIDMGSTTDKPETTSARNCVLQISPNLSNESSLMKLAEDAPQCGSTNVINGAMDCSNLPNDSLNRSGSGSNHGSSTAVNATGTTCMKSGFGQGRESGSKDASGSGSGTGVDENKLTIRQAALVKFRQKRKERSFKKKVQYQTRKRLAEQRPRVRGQFVKKPSTNSSNRFEDDISDHS